MDKEVKDLLEKYLRGLATSKEIQKVNAIIKNNPQLKELLKSPFNLENIANEYRIFKEFKNDKDSQILQHRIAEKEQNVNFVVLKLHLPTRYVNFVTIHVNYHFQKNFF